MSTVAVFVFLLDNLAGFNYALNDTLFQNAKFTNSDETPVIGDCDPFTTDQILNAVGQDLDLVILPSFRKNDNQFDNEQPDEQASEVFETAVADSSLPEPDVSRSFDENKSKFDNDLTTFSRKSFVRIRGENNTKNIQEVKNETKVEFPHSAPFLVAIFETLANITAQTCAGTLLTPRWVLTAANCINVLSNLYANNTKMAETSHYTIVAESSNPLLDGSAHNVTTIVLHPDSNTSRTTLEAEEAMDGSYMALMKIEPEVEGPALELMKGEVVKGDVMAYGWILSKEKSKFNRYSLFQNNSDTDHDTMECTSAASEILSHAECQAMYSFKDNDVLCLFSKDMDNNNVTQLSTGGPVLLIHDGKVKMLAVLQTDEEVFVSYPVAAHYDWILHTISNK